jgi:DNA-binding MarR family transcriptional regulator
VRKLRHADTASRSLSLLLKGHRISEIAQLRGLTQKTVIKHLRTFVDNGVIKLSDFHPSDRFWIRL